MQLQRGANTAVGTGTVQVLVDPANGSGSVEVSAYLLNEGGKVRSDADMIFYNQPSGGGGAIQLSQTGGASAFAVDLDRVPADVTRIVFCVTVDAVGAIRTLAGLGAASIVVRGNANATIAEYRPELQGATEAAMTFGELYRRAGEWKFRAVGQGFNGGLAPLARSFGIDVADESPAPPPTRAAAPATPPLPPPLPPATPVNLSKVSLEKKGQSVSLTKKSATFGEIVINLNWSRGKKGFFGGGNAVDLDLGCLVEMSDSQKCVVQALGRVFGDYHGPPYIQLDGDDRTGDVSKGETLRINGAQWSHIRRVAVYANIYDGAPNWQQTDGIVTVTMPDQPPIEVRMTEGRNDKRLCGVILLENDRGQIKATRIVDYYRDQSELDRAYGWGIRWTAGRKD